MAEVIATLNPEMPKRYEKLDGIEYVKQKDGTLRVNGILELGDGEEKIVRKILIPEPDTMWGYEPEEYEKYKEDPEKWEMAREIKRLSTRLANVEQELSRLRTPEGPPPENLASPSADNHTAEQSKPAPAARPEESEPQPAAAEEAAADIQVEPTEPEAQERGNLWHRISGRVGRFVIGSQAAMHNGVYNLADRQGRREVVLEEVRDTETVGGYTEHERRRGAAAIVGGAALVGAGVLAGWLIWGRHGGHDVINHYYSNGAEVAGPPVVPGGGNGGSAAMNSLSGSHVDFFDASVGHRLTAVQLPKELHLETISGHEAIVDNHGNLVASSSELPKGIADRQGNLSLDARKLLRAKGYILAQGKLGNRFMTIVNGS